ncbi:MAG TPA: metalloregulator ArsR/SmtB family transcription factor [Burkholderiales bacterium]|nr:metalloregulator ArsR/SmtB family transcription factor [Burkholderiales bacterium]
MESSSAVSALGALAQETRLAIFRLLVEKGPEGLCVGDIGSKLRLAPATLSFHLKELTHAGLLEARQEGRFIYYVPDFDHMNELVSYLTENCCGGEGCAPACAPARRKRKETVA